MLAFFRNLSKSTAGKIILVLFVAAIGASFALGDMSNIAGGNTSQPGATLAEVGGIEVTDRDMADAMQQRLTQVRQQNPEADYASIASDFGPLLDSLIDQRTLAAFARKNGFQVSKLLVDAEIANIPGTKGLDGKFSEQAYASFLQQQRLTDAQVRELISSQLLQRMLLTPAVTQARLPVGVASPYASMLLEGREGQVATIPVAAFRTGLAPTDADLQRFYAENRTRYMVPEQRVLRLAHIGQEQVAGAAASEQEILAFYNANQAVYGARDIRVISQVVVPDRNAANTIAGAARGGTALAAAAAAGGGEVIEVGPQTRAEFAGAAGDAVAAAAFAAESGAIVGPVQSEFGWHVVKVDAVRREGGKSLAEARSEIVSRLTADKRKNALADLVASVEDAVAAGSNFGEAAAVGKLQVISTPLITATGAARANPDFRFPAQYAPALRTGFEMEADDEPVVEPLADESGYVMVAPDRVVPATPAPLASIRETVAADWTNRQATQRAQAAAAAIAAKAARGVALADAVRQAGVALPPVQQVAGRRLDLSQMGDKVPASLRMLFVLGEGKSRMVADPTSGGFSVVKTTRIVPGNALSQPALIGRVQSDFQAALAEEYAQQFLTSIRASLKVKRNEAAIAASRKRIIGG